LSKNQVGITESTLISRRFGDLNKGKFYKVLNLALKRGEQGRTCGVNILYNMWFVERKKHVYMQVLEGQITYRVYTICSGEKNVCLQVANKVNYVSNFSGQVQICTC
jgi:hypothetical protein